MRNDASVGRQWYEPIDRVPAETTVEERAAILVDLLDLTDALLPMPRSSLTALPFKDLCGRD